MELALNLAWVLLAGVMFCIWMQFARCTGTNRRMQLVALTVLVLILFPVISVTDDLQAVRNSAEIDSCQRRDHGYSAPHSISSPVSTFPQSGFAGLSFSTLSVAAPGSLPTPVIDQAALGPIQNRPPPTA